MKIGDYRVLYLVEEKGLYCSRLDIESMFTVEIYCLRVVMWDNLRIVY